ncbi:MAG: hypothetical protein M3Y24_02020 [Acidobacteriota bacterium]|nr:hypothetical protein [Acidobacteriota bacterium]
MESLKHERVALGGSHAFFRPLLLILICILLVKTTILYVDPSPRLFLGDSRSYLYTALTGWIPPDRSFVYGFFVKLAAVWPHSLQALVFAQVALSVTSAWLVAVCLIRYLQTSVSVAAVCSLLCAIEPLQLLAERYVLTESVVTLMFAVFMLLCFVYLGTARLLPLALIQVCGVLLISLRISFLPMVIVCSFALPLFTAPASVELPDDLRGLLRVQFSSVWRLLRQVAVPLILGLLLSQTLLFGYRHLYGKLIEPPMRGHPAYFYRDGLFLISDFAPLIQPVDYPIANERAELFRPSPVPLPDPKARDAQRWYPEGICDRIIRACRGDEQCADDLARKTAIHALRRNPLAAVQLGLQTAALYFDGPYFLSTLITDEGYDIDLSQSQAAIYRQSLDVDFTSSVARFRKSPPLTERWHRALYLWYCFLLVLPLLFPAYLILQRRRALPVHWLCALFLLLFLEGAVLTVTRPTARFLTTMSWLSFIVLGSCVSPQLSDWRAAPKIEHVA